MRKPIDIVVVVSKLKKDIDKLYKEIDRRENDIEILEGR